MIVLTQSTLLNDRQLCDVPAQIQRPVGQRNTDYSSVTYSTVMSVSSHDNGDVYRCTIDFENENRGTHSDRHIDIYPPEFNFTWTSSPLNVECEYYAS